MSHLPPRNRTPLWAHVTTGAKAGELHLQHCAHCGVVQYPPREVCGACLSPDLTWRLTDGGGIVLSHTVLRASIDPWFRERLPVHVALVKLRVGPLVYAFAEEELATGADVTVAAQIDDSGQAVLWARKGKA